MMKRGPVPPPPPASPISSAACHLIRDLKPTELNLKTCHQPSEVKPLLREINTEASEPSLASKPGRHLASHQSNLPARSFYLPDPIRALALPLLRHEEVFNTRPAPTSYAAFCCLQVRCRHRRATAVEEFARLEPILTARAFRGLTTLMAGAGCTQACEGGSNPREEQTSPREQLRLEGDVAPKPTASLLSAVNCRKKKNKPRAEIFFRSSCRASSFPKHRWHRTRSRPRETEFNRPGKGTKSITESQASTAET